MVEEYKNRLGFKLVTSKCQVCGREFLHTRHWTPPTCGNISCVKSYWAKQNMTVRKK